MVYKLDPEGLAEEDDEGPSSEGHTEQADGSPSPEGTAEQADEGPSAEGGAAGAAAAEDADDAAAEGVDLSDQVHAQSLSTGFRVLGRHAHEGLKRQSSNVPTLSHAELCPFCQTGEHDHAAGQSTRRNTELHTC